MHLNASSFNRRPRSRRPHRSSSFLSALCSSAYSKVLHLLPVYTPNNTFAGPCDHPLSSSHRVQPNRGSHNYLRTTKGAPQPGNRIKGRPRALPPYFACHNTPQRYRHLAVVIPGKVTLAHEPVSLVTAPRPSSRPGHCLLTPNGGSLNNGQSSYSSHQRLNTNLKLTQVYRLSTVLATAQS